MKAKIAQPNVKQNLLAFAHRRPPISDKGARMYASVPSFCDVNRQSGNVIFLLEFCANYCSQRNSQGDIEAETHLPMRAINFSKASCAPNKGTFAKKNALYMLLVARVSDFGLFRSTARSVQGTLRKRTPKLSEIVQCHRYSIYYVLFSPCPFSVSLQYQPYPRYLHFSC